MMENYCIGKDIKETQSIAHDEVYLSFIIVHPTSIDGGSVVIRNSEDNTGEIVFQAQIVDNASSQHFTFPYPIKARNGLHIELSNVTATIGYFG